MSQSLKLSVLFDVTYGVNLELNKLEQVDEHEADAINFVSRTDKNNGISAIVKRMPHVDPNPANTISVAGGGSVLAAFLQPRPYYSGRDLYILTPKKSMTENEMLFYCYCIRKNRYRYNYGRQANKTLRDLLLPAAIPTWIRHIKEFDSPKKSSIIHKQLPFQTSKWKWFRYADLFDIDRGRGIRLKDIIKDGKYPFVTAIDNNNGWSGFTNHSPYHKGNVISVPRNGNGVAEAFYQPLPFCSTEDVHIFTPKFKLNTYIAIFLIALIRKEKYRYSYGRKWGLKRMGESIIKLPAKGNEPDFSYMENYVKSLEYSSSL